MKKHEKNKRLKAWHKEVCERAGWACEVCGRYGDEQTLCGHHIKSQGAYPALRFDVDNGICVDAFCHLKIHTGEIKPKVDF